MRSALKRILQHLLKRKPQLAPVGATPPAHKIALRHVATQWQRLASSEIDEGRPGTEPVDQKLATLEDPAQASRTGAPETQATKRKVGRERSVSDGGDRENTESRGRSRDSFI